MFAVSYDGPGPSYASLEQTIDIPPETTSFYVRFGRGEGGGVGGRREGSRVGGRRLRFLRFGISSILSLIKRQNPGTFSFVVKKL